jgi:hypothetical protein
MAGTATAQVSNWSFCIGEDKLYQVTVYQADGVTPQNVSGWTTTLFVTAYGDPNTTYFSAGGTPQGGGGTGVIQYSVPGNLTSGMKPDQYEYYIKRIDSGNDAIVTRGLLTLFAV